MTQTPEIMRRRLRLALREAREAAGLTQKQAAEALYASLSKIIRIEQGAVAITPVDLRALLAVYQVTDKEQVEELVELAGGSKKQSWAEYREIYSPATLHLLGSEEAARTIYKYEPHFIPGLLQTEEYAEALLIGLGHSKQDVELIVRTRLERQELLDREARPDLQFILGETAISRTVGGRGVMLRQLQRIRELAAWPGISLQVLPFSAGAHPHMGGAFTILQFADENLEDLLYLEDADGERTIRNEPDVLADYYEIFARLEGMATRPGDLADTLDKIEAQRLGDTADPVITSPPPDRDHTAVGPQP
jgi:transcriptional regulator with XRE-family HTH domain